MKQVDCDSVDTSLTIIRIGNGRERNDSNISKPL